MPHHGEEFRTYIFKEPRLRNLSRAAVVASDSETKSKEWRSAMYKIEKAVKTLNLDSDPKLKAWIEEKFPEFVENHLNQTTIIGDGNINGSPNANSSVNSSDIGRIKELEQEVEKLKALNYELTQQLIKLTNKILE